MKKACRTYGIPLRFFQKRQRSDEQVYEYVLNITNHQAMQIKTTVKYQFILVKMTVIKKSEDDKDVGKDVEKASSCTAGGNVHWCSRYEELCGDCSKAGKRELPSDPAIPLLGICTEGNEIRILKRYLHSPVYHCTLHNNQDMERT